jgi:hypothetical protein
MRALYERFWKAILITATKVLRDEEEPDRGGAGGAREDMGGGGEVRRGAGAVDSRGC